MTKRAKFLTALVAAFALVVVSPLAATAFWAVSTQVAASAQASTFAIAPYAVTTAGAGSSFTGWAGTTYHAAPLANSGATPWSGQTVSVQAASGFGPEAAATVQVAFTAASDVCQSDATYAGIAPQSALGASSWSSTAPVAPGATVFACIKLVVTDTDTRTPSGAAAPAPALNLTTTATAAQGNWTAQEQAPLAASSTGWAACTSTGTGVTLTLPAQAQPGNYTIVRNDTGATLSGNVTGNARTTLTLTNPASSGTEDADTYVTIKRAGVVVAVAKLGFRSSSAPSTGFTKSLACA
ncbi:hypothetical protein [Microbacterium sp.]|uniref:hypothetical protein n=1 Tax=Microbacterium sp. TaxID=51671 RepID=UPI0035B2140E